MSYTYKDPLKNGYKKVKLTKKQHNKLLPNTKIKWSERYEYYISDDAFITHRFAGILWKILITITLPLWVLFHGIENFKELMNEYLDLFKEKKVGNFLERRALAGTDRYKEIKTIIGDN